MLLNIIIEILKNKHYFQKDLLISHPKAIQKVLSTASKAEKVKRKNWLRVHEYLYMYVAREWQTSGFIYPIDVP